MSHHRRTPGMLAAGTRDLFTVPESPGLTRVPPEHITAYIAALESRCNTLWGYIQGYECPGDPVVGILAAELGVTVADAGPGMAAD